MFGGAVAVAHVHLPAGRFPRLACSVSDCRDDAERAIRTLNGYGYDNLILHVEWAAPRAERS